MSEKGVIKIGDIRSQDLDTNIIIKGKIVQISDVRPQIISAKYKCPDCKAVLSVEQIDKKFREPSVCKCGWDKEFILLSKEFIDARRIIVQELKDHYGARINVFLHDKLCKPKLEESLEPGKIVEVKGELREVPIILENGSMSTRFDIAMNAQEIKPLTSKESKSFSKEKPNVGDLVLYALEGLSRRVGELVPIDELKKLLGNKFKDKEIDGIITDLIKREGIERIDKMDMAFLRITE